MFFKCPHLNHANFKILENICVFWSRLGYEVGKGWTWSFSAVLWTYSDYVLLYQSWRHWGIVWGGVYVVLGINLMLATCKTISLTPVFFLQTSVFYFWWQITILVYHMISLRYFILSSLRGKSIHISYSSMMNNRRPFQRFLLTSETLPICFQH